MLSKVRSHFFEHGKLYILIVVFLLLTSTYNITLPLGRGYDEFAHFQYIRFMAEHLRPPMTETERGQGGYKSRHHPPFYQGVAGFLFSWVDSEDTVFKRVVYGDIPQEALIFEVQDVHWFLPTEIMNYPYQQAILLWHLSRLFSSLLSAGAIIVTYFTALELFPGKKTWVLLAAATLAFIPRFVYTSSVASDDNMLAFLMALYLFLMVRLIKGCDHWCLFILLGVVLGLGITTKFSIGLVPVMTIAIFGFLAWRQSWPWKTLVKRTAVLTLTICLVSSWWFIFVIWNFNKITTEGFFWGILNAVLPHVVNNVSGADLLAAFQDPPMVERQPLLMGPWLIHLGQSFWAVPFITTLTGFPLEPGVFWLVLMVAGLVIVGWIMVWPRLNQVQQISLVILGLFILSFLPFMLMRYYLNGIIFETAQGRHILMPAAAAVGILLMVGWAGWTRPTVFNWLRPLLPMFLLFWSLIHLHYIYNVYPKPLPLSINSTTMLQVDTPVNLMFFDSFEFVGYNVDVLPDQAILETTLVWQAHQPASKDYLVEVQLLNQQGQLVSHWISHAADGLYPTRVWERGEIIYDRVKLPIYNLNAGSYTLQAYLLEAYQQPLLQVAGPLFSEP
ncbi:MAG: glycosyltransferase family 39 protein, partial [Anaerolineae bacterium]|nr:glycosyltransferase family 39 protein [Anaerolineae bacterium]